MSAAARDRLRTGLYALVLLAAALGVWQGLAGAGGKGKGDGLPGPLAVGRTAVEMLRDPFYDRGPNDKGFGIQLGWSLGRMLTGYVAASVVAVLVGVALGSSPALFKAANPFIQVLKPISPLAWMPLFLYTIKNSSQAAILVIFMSSLWPTMANTAFGVHAIRKEYVQVGGMLQLSWWRRIFLIILPAAAPATVAGLRISFGSALIAVVPAEMLLGVLGVGYMSWNHWNNNDIAGVIFCILVVGVIGFCLDMAFNLLSKRVTYSE